MKGQGRVYLRKGKWWWVSFRLDGREYRESAASILRVPWSLVTERDARNALDIRLKGVYSGRFVEPQHKRLTVGECLDALVVNLEVRKVRSLRELARMAERLKGTIGSWRASDACTPRIEQLAQTWLRAEQAPATVRNKLGFVVQALRLAVDHHRLAEAPRVPRIHVDNAREGCVTPEQFPALHAAMLRPGRDRAYADCAEWAWLTAWRKSETIGLAWDRVDRTRGTIRLERSKNGKKRYLPLEGRLAELIEERWKVRGIGVPWVFHRNGKAINGTVLTRHFKRAGIVTGVPGLIFHDLRRSAVTNMEYAGVPRSDAMAISGHRTESSYRRYGISRLTGLAAGLRRTQAYLADTGADTHRADAAQA